ncbi:hypothetical protein K1719_008093 [Acacia pycnantha]|nr:hypothetical protein K1719_008093 [Acacia pycnantha]
MDPSHNSNEDNQIPTNDNTITDPDNHDDDDTLHNEFVSVLDMFATFSDAMEEEDGLQGVDNGGDGLDFDVGDIRGYIEEVMRNEQEMMRIAMTVNNQNGYDPTAGPVAGTPATESSIEALEKVTVVEQKEEEEGSKTGKFECSICFEGSSNDPEASRMPCSHLFHTKCIISWLHTRNTCPLCRFEMPTGW